MASPRARGSTPGRSSLRARTCEGSRSMPQHAFSACRSRARSWSPPPCATCSRAQGSSSRTGASSNCAASTGAAAWRRWFARCARKRGPRTYRQNLAAAEPGLWVTREPGEGRAAGVSFVFQPTMGQGLDGSFLFNHDRSTAAGAAPTCLSMTSPRSAGPRSGSIAHRTGCSHRRVVGVHLHQLQPSRQLARELLERRAHHPARTAPGRPYVNEHWDCRGLGNRGEVGVCRVYHPAQRGMALSAAWRTFGHGRNAVLRLTVGTHHNLRRGVYAHAAALSSGDGPLKATTVNLPSTTSTEVTPPPFTTGRPDVLRRRSAERRYRRT